MTDRGVSEAIGFILIFSVVIATVATVYVFGVTGLQNTREQELTNNVQRSFTVLDSNIDDHRRKGTQRKRTLVSVRGGSIRMGDPVTINVTAINNTTSATPYSTGNITIEPITYTSADESVKVHYVGGAVVREQQREGAIVSRPPPVFFSNATGVIPIVQTTGENDRTLAGDRLIRVQSTLVTRDVLNSSPRYNTLVVNMTTPNADAWGDYFNESIGDAGTCSTNVSMNTVDCQVGGFNRTSIPYYNIGISLEG